MEPDVVELIVKTNVDGMYIKGFDTTTEQSVFSKDHRFDLRSSNISDVSKLKIIDEILGGVTHKGKDGIEVDVFSFVSGTKKDLIALKAEITGEELPEENKSGGAKGKGSGDAKGKDSDGAEEKLDAKEDASDVESLMSETEDASEGNDNSEAMGEAAASGGSKSSGRR